VLQSLNAMLPRGREPRVLVIGDLILDEYLRGRVERISPEAPVPVLSSHRREAVPGGAANVANNLAALGCDVLLCGTVGDDGDGERLLALLAERNIRTHGVIRDRSRPTTHKLRVVAHQQQVLRIDREESRAADDTVVTDALEIARHSLAEVDGVICSDYQKGFVTPELLAGLVEATHAGGKRLVVDPKGSNYSRYRGFDLLTPNRAELAEAVGYSVEASADRDRAARQIFEVTAATGLLVTCGRDGMVLYERSGEVHSVPAEAREVFDVTGAGDTVAAVVGLGLFAGVPLADAARLANAAASIVVGKLGTAIVGRNELEDWLAGQENSAPKVVSLAEAAQVATKARAAGKRVVTTNGCFDLLHPGHVKTLEAARGFGDLLIVGVNSDPSVRRLKGASRPLLPEAARARVVAALGCVDYVVVFPQPDPVELVRAIQPDVHVKGGDYRPDDIVEREAVEVGGGRLELLDLEPGWSTTSIVEAMAKRHDS
jgi:D-beta-D-heptose 7-phosphate kinase/D-beta-D-heptose 1-phosphate adenosyltransferase